MMVVLIFFGFEMTGIQKLFCFFSFFLCFFIKTGGNDAFAARAELKQIRMAVHADRSVRFVADLNQEVPYYISILPNPNRILIDFEDTSYPADLKKQTAGVKKGVKDLRIGTIHKTNTRVVLELSENILPKKAFYLAPQSGFSWRFVIDFKPVTESQIASFQPFGTMKSVSLKNSSAAVKNAGKKNTSNKKPIIVIDAGHGGKDPGAIGISGQYEKHLTLAMAKEVRRQLLETGRYQVFMTRDKDISLTLPQRIQIAHRHEADLFASFHADSASNKKARGLSVYTISEKASDREAAALAERENKADIILGIDLSNETKEVSNILIDLAKRDTMDKSSTFASLLVGQMRKKVALVPDAHRFAGFFVLKSPSIPSVLVEMGYLSNRQEEKLLKQASYRKKLATAFVKAVDAYFDQLNE